MTPFRDTGIADPVLLQLRCTQSTMDADETSTPDRVSAGQGRHRAAALQEVELTGLEPVAPTLPAWFDQASDVRKRRPTRSGGADRRSRRTRAATVSVVQPFTHVIRRIASPQGYGEIASLMAAHQLLNADVARRGRRRLACRRRCGRPGSVRSA